MNPGIYPFPGPHVWQSPPVAIAAGETTFPLPIQREPDIMQARLVCIAADGNWGIGDVIDGNSVHTEDGVYAQTPFCCLGYSRCGDGFRGGGLTIAINTLGDTRAFKRYSNSGIPFTLDDAKWQVRAIAIWFDP
jgi:hypothetical protein